MSWIGPCWLLKIVPWYFLKGKTPHHMHKKSNMPYTTTSPIPPTNLPDRRNPMQQKGIYNIEWVLRWRFSAYHCEPNVSLYDARCTYITHETERFFSWLHTTIILTPTIGGRIAIHEKNISYWVGTEKVVGMLYMGAKRISMHSNTNVKWVSSSAGCT